MVFIIRAFLYKYVSVVSFSNKMGQVCPLPKQIPVPPEKQQQDKLKAMGILLESREECYSAYTLPDKWHIYNQSHREDLPCYEIVDEKNMVRVTISGSWKGNYDNKLTLNVLSKPVLFQPMDHETKPAESALVVNCSKVDGSCEQENLEDKQASDSDSEEDISGPNSEQDEAEGPEKHDNAEGPSDISSLTEWNTLLRKYYATIEMTVGCGDRADHYIESAYSELIQFRTQHPELTLRLPQKRKAVDDGMNGTLFGACVAHAYARKHC